MQLNDIFLLEQYDEAYLYVSAHEGLTITEIAPENGRRRFQITEAEPPSSEGVVFTDE